MSNRKAKYFIVFLLAASLLALFFAFSIHAPAYAAEELPYNDGQVFHVSAECGGAPYSSGVQAEENVSVTMSYTNTPNSNTIFQFAEVSAGTQYPEIPAENWKVFSEDGEEQNNGLPVTRTFVVPGSVKYDKYFFFRSVFTSITEVDGQHQEITTYYSDKQNLHVVIVPRSEIGAVSITSEYKATAVDEYKPYEGGAWVAESIRYTISIAERAELRYRYTDATGKYIDWIPIGVASDAITKTVRTLLVDKELFPNGYQGNIEFAYGAELATKEVEPVKFDPVAPEFRVSSTYKKGATSPKDVVYELSQEVKNLSGIQYYYYNTQNPPVSVKDQEVHPIASTGNKYIYTALSTTKNLRFMAVSTAGKMYIPHDDNWVTNIDKVYPKATVTAQDAQQKTILSGGWASNTIQFILKNESVNAGAKFKYLPFGASEWLDMEIVNGQYTYATGFPQNYLGSTMVGLTCKFKIISAAGLESEEITFNYSLAKSTFPFGMDTLNFTENVWINSALELVFRTDSKDYKFGYRVQNAEVEKPLVALAGEWFPAVGGYEFRSKLAGSINGFAVNFVAINMAGVESPSISSGGNIKMDTEDSKLELKGSISGAAEGSYIGEGQWVSGKVNLLFLSVGANISGFEIIKLIKGGDGFYEGTPLTKKGDNYVDSISETSVNYYRVTTGAGKVSIISYSVNIDNSAIKLLFYEVKIGEDGIWLTQEEAKAELAKEVSKNVYLRFASNHVTKQGSAQINHFVYYYALNGATAVRGDESGIYCLNLDAKTDKGIIKVEFYLKSTATDAAGISADTSGDKKSITVKYNKIGATLTVRIKESVPTDPSDPNDPTKPGNWFFTAVTFVLNNLNDTGEAGLYRYQYSTNAKKTWVDISNFAMVNHTGEFVWGTEPVHLDGKMYFRVLNSAGYSSGEPTAVSIKIDTTTPSTFRSINFNGVQYTLEGDKLYYAGDLLLQEPVSAGYAPTSFYYATTLVTPPTGNGEPIAGSGWTKISGNIKITRTLTLSLYATNGKKSEYKKIDVIIDDTTTLVLTLGYSDAEGTMIGNNFQFNWAVENAITLSAAGSSTDVKYYYCISGSNVWVPMQADDVWNTAGVRFSYVFKNDIRANVEFKAVNKGGKVAFANKAIVLQIDKTAVNFVIDATVDGKPYSVESYKNNGWSIYDIAFAIRQTSVNPSGVRYEYALGAIDNANAPGSGWSALADMNLTSRLVDLNNNGNLQGTLWIRAAKNAATGVWEQKSVKFKVDKLAPNFNLEAGYRGSDGTEKKMASGQWVNTKDESGKASAVIVSLRDRAVTADPVTGHLWTNSSKVTYTYLTGGMSEWQTVDDTFTYVYSNAARTTIQFRATSEAGKVVEKTFELNIDNLAPEFHNGNGNTFSIVNGENGALNAYYVDQTISWINETDESLLSATVNGLPIIRGGIVSTYDTYLGTPGTEDYGKITIIVKDRAGNTAELKFILRPFPLTVENISLSAEDKAMLDFFELAVNDAKTHALRDNARSQYFTNLITRLRERVSMLINEISYFKAKLKDIYVQAAFTLETDYKNLAELIAQYKSYPLWQQESIRKGTFILVSGGEVTYEKAYNNMVERFSQLDVLMSAVKQVEQQVTLLPAVKAVKKTDYDNIMKAYVAYQSLSSDQKSSFQTTLAIKLVELKKQCELLLLQDDKLGVSIFGDQLTAGAKLFARSIDSATGDFANTQRNILSGYPDSAPRALISLMKLSLTDFGSDASANPTGKIVVTMAIPEKYQQYLFFAVYSVDGNGTVTKIENVEVSANGRTVVFTTNSLGTYALATAATVVERGAGSDVYGTIFGIEIDAKMIIYILIGVAALIILLIVVIILTGLRRRTFLKRYDRRYKQGLAARGVTKVPKGNRGRRRNPLDPDQIIYETKLIEPKKKKEKFDEFD